MATCIHLMAHRSYTFCPDCGERIVRWSPATKTVYQWRYRNKAGKWTIAKNLYTEDEAGEWGIKHAGPFEVDV